MKERTDTHHMDTKGEGTPLTWKGLFTIKSLKDIFADSEKAEYQLKRALGPVQLILFGIGAIIGAGIFATIGTAAAGDAFRPGAGPALMFSFVLTALTCGFTAMCYAEFASIVPISGSAYTYSYATLGELVAWIIGWDLIIEYAVGNIAVAISWANYFKTLLRGLGVVIPDWCSMDYRTAARIVDASGVHTVFRDAPHVFGVPVVFNVLAVLIVAAITLVLIWGIRESSRFNAVMVGIKLLVLAFFVIVGARWVQPANYHPFAPNGWAGVSAGAAIVFFAYIGFDAVSTVAEETRDPQRNLPRGIIGSLVICTILYVVVAAVFTGLISYPDLRHALASEQAEPLTMALAHVKANLGWAVGIVAFGSVIAHIAVLLVFQLGQPRILFSMSRDGLLPPLFRKVHARFRTPHVATILTGVFVASFAAVASIDEMVDLTNIGTLFAFILVCAGIIILRRREPDLKRPFRAPGGLGWALGIYVLAGAAVLFLAPWPPLAKGLVLAAGLPLLLLARNLLFPVLGILSCLYLIYFLPPTSWLRFAAWLNIGFTIYATYGVKHSRLTGRTPDNAAAHDVYAARTGAALALLGTLLLVAMRALDLALTALKAHPGGPGRLGAVLAATLKGGAWTEASWFLLVPLVINAFILCPIVIKRILRHRRRAGALSAPLRGSLAFTIALPIVSILYIARVLHP
jgi:basic amino acid/polyamine antiporter, APA family